MLDAKTLKKRIGKVTSSIAPACLGADPNCSPADAVDRIMGKGPVFEGSKATQRGDLAERVTLEYGLEALSLMGAGQTILEQAPFVTHPEGWAGDSSDALYVDSLGDVVAVGEAKTVGLGNRWQWGEPGTDQVPEKVYIQACWHLLHWPEAQVCVVPVMFGGYDFSFEHYVIERDGKLLDRLFDRLRRWHKDHVSEGKPVPLCPQDVDRLLRQWPCHTETQLEADDDFADLVEHCLEADAIIDAAQHHRDDVRLKIRERMQEHAVCKSADWSVLYRKPKDSKCIDWQGVARELGASDALIEKYTSIKPNSRRLMVSATKRATQCTTQRVKARLQ